jgi:hypothetical protein
VLDITNNFYHEDNENIDRVFEQFTGLQDKNGVDIYDNDYVLLNGQRILVNIEDFLLMNNLKLNQIILLIDGNTHQL